MENKTAKITATQLYELLADTNAKVTEIEKRTGSAVRTRGSFGLRLSLLLMLLGAALVAGIIWPACKSFLGLTLNVGVWNCVHLIYANLALSIAFLANINRAMRFSTAIMAFAPIAVSIAALL